MGYTEKETMYPKKMGAGAEGEGGGRQKDKQEAVGGTPRQERSHSLQC